MATPQLSPGVITREVDLTVGRADNVINNVGAIAGPFSIGPVGEAIDISNEQELINTFGKPLSTDAQYEYWMSASSFLSYGGILKVARADGSTLNNANAGVGSAFTTNSKIKSYDNWQTSWSDASVDYTYAAKNPGTWANTMKVCFVDDLADQTVGIATTNPAAAGCVIGYGVTTALENQTMVGNGVTSVFNGYLKGIITGITTDTSTAEASTFDVKIVSRVETVGGAATETLIDYKEYDQLNSFLTDNNLNWVDGTGTVTANVAAAGSCTDWYNAQTLGLTNSTVYWRAIAPKPTTNQWVSDRNGKNDAMHVVVVDDTGSITGIRGNILEKHISISKAKDTVSSVNSPQKIYYKDFLAQNSAEIYSGSNVSSASDTYWGTAPRATGFSTALGTSASFLANTTAEGLWGQDAQGIVFSSIGAKTYTLTGGIDYSASGGMVATLGDLTTSYNLFSNKDETDVDFLICGPGLGDQFSSQAKANHLISIAEDRKDCIACISPHRANVVNVTNVATQANNVVNFFSPLSSSSYAVFDSGYKYTYDRFNNQFRYIPCNGDIAGLMVRTDIEQYPWYSPAGQQRGILNNAIKLAFNPNKSQRDTLYEARVNSIINQPGTGSMLYGDKTGLSFASAFDRINVRRLFLTIEQSLQSVANAQLFEFNDQITRANFVNVVEPYLRDVQAKRGIYDFRVICDTTNNTPSVIDNNEFRADIFIKPTKAINYVTLTFVATRTGVSFEEVTGTV